VYETTTIQQPKIIYREMLQLFFYSTSVDTEMCCPKGRCGCQYFILLTLKKSPGFFLIKH
jgi:hypothetical protein